MKKVVIVGLIIFLSGIGANFFAQNATTKKSVMKKVIPNANLLIAKKQNKTYIHKVKEKFLPENTNQYRKKNNVPQDFPIYKDTGNPKQDLSNYHDAKQVWIKTHRKEFLKIKHLAL